MTVPQQPGWPVDGQRSAPPQGYGQGYAPPPQGQGYGQGYGPPPLPGAYPVPPAYGYPVAPQTDGTAIVVLVLAISSFVVFPVVPAIVALVLAPGAERDIAASGGRLTGDSMVRAGRMVAWIHLGLCLAFLLVIVLVFGAFGAVVSAD